MPTPKPKAISMVMTIKGEVKTQEGVQWILKRTTWTTVSQKYGKKSGETKFVLRAVG